MNKKIVPILAVIVALVLSTLACGGPSVVKPTLAPVVPTKPVAVQPTKPAVEPTKPAALPTKPAVEPTRPVIKEATKTPLSQPTEPPQAGLQVLNVYGFTDTSGDYHVTGAVKNGETKALTQIELTIEVKDASGKSLLQDDKKNVVDSLTFNPLLATLEPGEISPFDYYLSSDAGKPDKYNVTVTGQNTAKITRANLEVKNPQMVDDNSGYIYISGELVNKSSQPVNVDDLAAGLLDKDGKVVSADNSYTFAISLDPSGAKNGTDSTPFVVSLYKPEVDVKDMKVYVNAEEVDAWTSYDLNVDFSKNYFDDLDSYHIITLVSNKSDQILHIDLVGGLYDKDKNVIDASTTSVPFDLNPGDTMPVDVSSFMSVDFNKDQANKLDTFTVQIDPYGTYETALSFVKVDGGTPKLEKDGNTWKFSGEIANNSGKVLTDMTVVVIVYDENNNAVATNWTVSYPTGDTFKAGDKGAYDVSLYLSPKLDQSKLTYKVQVQGTVK